MSSDYELVFTNHGKADNNKRQTFFPTRFKATRQRNYQFH